MVVAEPYEPKYAGWTQETRGAARSPWPLRQRRSMAVVGSDDARKVVAVKLERRGWWVYLRCAWWCWWWWWCLDLGTSVHDSVSKRSTRQHWQVQGEVR